jgi:hypothetical protein
MWLAVVAGFVLGVATTIVLLVLLAKADEEAE